MIRRLNQIEKRLEQKTTGGVCLHGGNVQVIKAEPDGSWEHKERPPEPCPQCGLYPLALTVIIGSEKAPALSDKGKG